MRYTITGHQTGAIGVFEHLANVEASTHAEAFERAEYLRPEFEHLQPAGESCPACQYAAHHTNRLDY